MVTLIQKVLQLYAARALTAPGSQGADAVLNSILAEEEQNWDRRIKQGIEDGDITQVCHARFFVFFFWVDAFSFSIFPLNIFKFFLRLLFLSESKAFYKFDMLLLLLHFFSPWGPIGHKTMQSARFSELTVLDTRSRILPI